MGGHFRYSVWDPFLIICQIIVVQSFYYVSLGAWICFTNVISGSPQSLDQIFLYKELHVRDMHGRCITGSFLLNSLCSSVSLWWYVKRTKSCLDFTVTTHFIHLIVCWCYNGFFPYTASWWVLNVICIIVMCVCGEFLCMRTEMKAIPLSIGPKADL